MRKLLSFLPFVLLVVIFASCDESKETSKYHNWRERNEAFIDSLRNVFDSDPDLNRILDSRNKNNYIYYKKKEANDTGEVPYYTSAVTTYYRAMLIDEGVFTLASGTEQYYTNLYKNLDVVISNFKNADPNEFDTPTKSYFNNDATYGTYNFAIGGTGCQEILQHMHVGERWEIYLPWECAYGSYGASSSTYTHLFQTIPAYSAIIAEIILVDVDNPTE